MTEVFFVADTDHPVMDLWCYGCNTFAGVQFPLIAMTMDGVEQLGSIVSCLECGEFDDEDGWDGREALAG